MIGTSDGRIARRAGALVVVPLVLSLALAACGGSSKKTSTPTADNWPVVGNTLSNTRYSTLSQVNSSNVNKLGIAWARPQGSNLTTWEDYPVVVNGTMYITTSADEVEALNAATGAVKWTYTPKVNFFLAVAGGGGGVPTNRGVAVANGKVYLTTFDDQLVALQQATGEKLFQTQVADPNQGYSETASPTVYGNTVYIGSAESDAGLRGFVAAYDATTGQQKWRFYAVPAPGHSWVPAKGNHGGGDVWMEPTIDPSNNTLYFGTGNPSPDLIISDRKGCDPYVDSTVAVNASTGALKWAHQEVCPDAWDYDTHQPPMYFNLTVGGKTTQVVGNANKSGYYTVMNAGTGQVISKSPYITQFTTPHPVPTPAGVNVCPGATGGVEYSPASYSPQTGAVYQDAMRLCDRYISNSVFASDIHQTGQIDFGGTFTPLTNPPPAGYLASIDAATGKINWENTLPKPSTGGTMSTAGGLVFVGDDDGKLYAVNAHTGKVLWTGDIGLPFGAAPMTYKVGNTQYVAVVAGGSNVAAIENVPTGGELVVFKLGGSAVHTFPAVSPLSSMAAQALPDLASYTKVGPYVYVNPTSKRAVVQVVAAATSENSGFNFNGYSKGKANFVVPVGWTITLEFSNKSSTPHSVAITGSLKLPLTPVIPAGGIAPVAIPGVATFAHGLTASAGTVAAGFSSNTPGHYYLVCGVPGHVQAGMWDFLTVSASAKQPSIQVK
ncbi:MAG TPA: PQQ-binding-like beta-propeller repeat protein [Solirubrobacteraceae bacterium]|nr:PQQ-binding-like beta-propeller repeat protein [Solirubrobacteraceae bacterium]